MDTRIVWLRRDLRLDDHPALHAALADDDDTRVVPLFVWDPALIDRGRVSPARLAYLCEALADLDGQLRDRGTRLVMRSGAPDEVVAGVASDVHATAVHWTRDFTPYARTRDDAVREALAALDDAPAVVDHPGVLIHEPGSVLTGGGDPYKVFTPFHRTWRQEAIAAWPEVLTTEFNERYRGLPWSDDGEEVDAWRDGMTGYPIVDAGMRQLLRTGWMHNRARMIVASFLCKDLLVDRRIGERHFLEHLVDGDLASNNGGWQWAAGTGTDAQPYFRVFNPVTQGERFDPDGAYVRRWVPELTDVPDTYIHHPWDMSDEVAADCGVTIGADYPAPIVDHGEARQRALAWFDEHRTE